MTSTTQTDKNHQYTDLTKPDTNNATYIGCDDWQNSEYWLADFYPLRKKPYYKYLNRLNSGMQNGPKGNNQPYETFRMNSDCISILGNQLMLTRSQRDRAARIITKVDLEQEGRPSEEVAFCICAYVVHDSDGDVRHCHPSPGPDSLSPPFNRIKNELGITNSAFQSTYAKVAHRDGVVEKRPRPYDKYELDSSAQHRWR